MSSEAVDKIKSELPKLDSDGRIEVIKEIRRLNREEAEEEGDSWVNDEEEE